METDIKNYNHVIIKENKKIIPIRKIIKNGDDEHVLDLVTRKNRE